MNMERNFMTWDEMFSSLCFDRVLQLLIWDRGLATLDRIIMIPNVLSHVLDRKLRMRDGIVVIPDRTLVISNMILMMWV